MAAQQSLVKKMENFIPVLKQSIQSSHRFAFSKAVIEGFKLHAMFTCLKPVEKSASRYPVACLDA